MATNTVELSNRWQAVHNRWRHWRPEKEEDNILWLYLDKAGASTNTLSREVLEELDQIVSAFEDNRDMPKGLVFISAKKNGFLAGADIHMLQKLEGLKDPVQTLRETQKLFDRIEALPFPTVAAIHGFCLGGGLELALVCRYRVAEKTSARLGLPEVKLGLHPGWGGTVRLPKLIGATDSLELILKGKPVDAERARDLSLIDYAVPGRQFKNAARQLIMEPPKPHRLSLREHIASASFLSRPVALEMQRRLSKSVRREHYPAPYAVLDLWEHRGGRDREMFEREAESFVALSRTKTSHNLIRTFLIQEELKGLGHGNGFPPEHIHIIGAGTMGADIGAWCALRGMTVTVQDVERNTLGAAVKKAAGLFMKRLREKRQITAARDRFIPDMEGYGLSRADVVLEAIPEKAEAKKELYRNIEARLKPKALLATNTSSIPLSELTPALEAPERLLGCHFFNPVSKMKIVEIVRGEATSEDAVNKASEFMRIIDRIPLPVKSRPGFYINRVLMPYLMEAVTLYREGVSPEVLDEVAERFGMAMGPAETADMVGLDICLSVGENLTRQLGGEVPGLLNEWVNAGRLGRKSGKGFYDYKEEKPQKPKPHLPEEDELRAIEHRLIYRMLNEAIACRREEIVGKDAYGDIAMVLGTGFAPFRGGPMSFIRQQGVGKTKQRLNELERNYGERFRADEGWEQL